MQKKLVAHKNVLNDGSLDETTKVGYTLPQDFRPTWAQNMFEAKIRIQKCFGRLLKYEVNLMDPFKKTRARSRSQEGDKRHLP